MSHLIVWYFYSSLNRIVLLLVVKNLLANAQDVRQVRSLGWEDLLERKWKAIRIFLPGESHGQRNLVGCSAWGAKSWTSRLRILFFVEFADVFCESVLWSPRSYRDTFCMYEASERVGEGKAEKEESETRGFADKDVSVEWQWFVNGCLMGL